MKHLKYLWYVLKHKYYVFVACMVLDPMLFWQAVIHDWSKFTPTEWFPYVEQFYGKYAVVKQPDSKGYIHQPGKNPQFDAAWKHHWKNNPHHWQYWCIKSHINIPVNMPDKYVKEMVCDWYGAGMAQGKPDILGWYYETEYQRNLTPDTQDLVKFYLDKLVEKDLI